MKIIGIMGGSGCGKSFLCDLFSQLGAYTVSADEVYHNELKTNAKMLLEIEKSFGQSVFDNEVLNREKLAEIVFHDENKLLRLNQITHHYVTKSILAQLEQKKNEKKYPAFVIDAPLLFKTPLIKLCDEVIFVFCDLDTRLQRIMKRDNISESQAKQRINAQPGDAEFQKFATLSVDGNTDRNKLIEIVRGVIN